MIRTTAAVVAGLLAWFVVATVINLGFRAAWPGYAAVEAAMTFTLPMLAARLICGAMASIAAGFVVAWITRGIGMPVWALAILLLVLFIPVHYGLWDKFPGWYHLTFLASLLPLTLLGAWLKTPKAAQVSPTY